MHTCRNTIVISAATCLLAGCAAKNDPSSGISKVPRDQADDMTAHHARFDNAKDPKPTAPTHFAAGQLAESQGATGQAILQYQRAAVADPRHLPSFYRLGVLYAQAQAYPDAIHAWNHYLKVSGNDATAWSNLGYCHELAAQLLKAEEAYRQGIARDAKSKPCRINYGLMLARLGREEDAITQLQFVLPPAQVHYNLASVYEQQGRKTDAVQHYQRAIELAPDLVEARERLAKLEE
jgi:tetratricopeptide (TPR) repeat protein